MSRPDQVRDKVIDALQQVYDPEIPVDIYRLGLVYEVEVDVEAARVEVTMTLTSPACPVAGSLVEQVEARLLAIEEIQTARVSLVWDPPWSPDMMTEEARLELGFF